MLIYSHRLLDQAEAMPQVITRDQARSWAKIDGTGPDADLDMLIASALEACETVCEQPLFARTYVATLEGIESGLFDTWHVTDIVSVTYRSGGQTLTLNPDQYELVGEMTHACGLEFTPQAETIDTDRVTVTFKAGFAANAVPASVKLAIQFWIVRRYDYRDGFKDDEFMRTFSGQLSRYANPHIV